MNTVHLPSKNTTMFLNVIDRNARNLPEERHHGNGTQVRHTNSKVFWKDRNGNE